MYTTNHLYFFQIRSKNWWLTNYCIQKTCSAEKAKQNSKTGEDGLIGLMVGIGQGPGGLIEHVGCLWPSLD